MPKAIALNGLLLGGGAVASSAGAWQTYSGLFSSGVSWSYSPSDLVTIREDESSSIRLEINNTGSCFRQYFPGLYMSWQFISAANKGPAGLDANTYGTGTDEVKGCLLVDLKYRDTDKQKAISLGTELTLIKGNYGLAVWSNLNNLANDPLREKIYAVRLSKDTAGKWKADQGYSWKPHSPYSKLEIYLDKNKIGELDSTDASSCAKQDDNKCELFSKLPPTKNEKYFWNFKSEAGGTERIFTKLKIQEKDGNPDFWGLEDIFADSTLTKDRGFNDFTFLYDGSVWNSRSNATLPTATNPTDLQKSLKAWFKPFTDSKGTWTEASKSKN